MSRYIKVERVFVVPSFVINRHIMVVHPVVVARPTSDSPYPNDSKKLPKRSAVHRSVYLSYPFFSEAFFGLFGLYSLVHGYLIQLLIA